MLENPKTELLFKQRPCYKTTPNSQSMSFVTKRYSSSLVQAVKARSKEDFERELAKNQVLWQLWNLPHLKPQSDADSTINATSTLPIIYRTKAAVFHDVQKENPEPQGFTLKLKQFTGYAKSIIHFYRIGIKNVWNNQRDGVKAIKNKYYVESVDTAGKIIKRKISNSQDLIKVLTAFRSLDKIEQDVLKTTSSNEILNITRREYQTIIRTQQDFFKLPLFGLILLIFAETTPLICFLFPKLTPSTCVFPSLLTKINKSSTDSIKRLTELRLKRYDYSNELELPVQNLWKLPKDELYLLIKFLNLKSIYLPIEIYPMNLLRERLQLKFNEIALDNAFLLDSVSSSTSSLENFWSLNKNELIRSCVDRGLIDFTKDDLNHIGNHELRMRLFFHLGLFANNTNKLSDNVGLFGLNHLKRDDSYLLNNINHEDSKIIYQWWINKHT